MECEKNKSGVNVIKIKEKDDEKGFYTLLTNGSVKCLKNNRYIVPDYCIGILKKEGINFEIEA